MDEDTLANDVAARIAHHGDGRREPWYLRFPFSSLLPLSLALVMTAAAWAAISSFDEMNNADGFLPSVVGWSISVILVLVLFGLMWFFRPGILASIFIAFVAWYHVGMMGLSLFWIATGQVYDFPQQIPSVLGVLCLAFFVALFHGIAAGLRSGR